MSVARPSRLLLPAGWYYPEAEEAWQLRSELGRELPPGHLLEGVAVEVFAGADGNDDVRPRHRRRRPWGLNHRLYHRRNQVERLFRRLKGYLRIFTRYDKLDTMFLAFIHLALIFDALR